VAGQIVEVPFRGTGWVYLGESDSKRGINYNTRRLDPEGQTFIFQALEAGTYGLKFYRQDFIRDYLINDLVTLIVEDPPLDSPGFGVPVDRGRVIAEPRWPTIPGEPSPVTETAPPVPPNRAGPAANTRDTAPREAAPAALPASPPVPEVSAPATPSPTPAVSSPATIPETEAPPSMLPPGTPAEEYLRRAREEYGADHIPEAIAILNQFMAQFPLGSDEALWLYAQLYEKQGPFRDIRLSLDYYRRLVNEYPQSNRYNDSRRRIAYLERYYINIQ
jgi:TolA-binding protein